MDGIKCKMPPTVAVPYPQLQVYNPETFRAAAFGVYAGDVAYGRSVMDVVTTTGVNSGKKGGSYVA